MPRALLCLVTDRRRLGEALGCAPEKWHTLLLEQIEGAVRGGIDLVQIRERDLDGGALASLVRDVVAIAQGSGTRVLVNDRADVAVAAGASGVHVPERGLRGSDVRRLGQAFLVGRSVHSTAAARDADADYLIAGTVFPSESKSRSITMLGLHGLGEIVRARATIPVLAIGGVTETTIESVVGAGAAGVAAIGAFIPRQQPSEISQTVEKTVRDLRFAFDTAASGFLR